MGISPIKLAHVVLRTVNYQSMVDWWCRLLGASVRHGNDFLSFLSYDEEHHRLAIVKIPHLVPQTRTEVGVEHMAFTFATVGDLFVKYEELRNAGVSPYWTINHGMTLSAYYKDPDGNQVELQVDAMGNEDADRFMNSPTFAENPIGIDVNFEDLIVRHRAGESTTTLLSYPLVP